MMSTGLLPDPEHVTSLCRLAAHDDPDVRNQATALCSALPLPIRLRAAERLAARGEAVAVALCIWPDAPGERAQFLRGASYALATALRPLWLEAHPGDERLDRYLSAVAERDRSGAAPLTLRHRRQALARARTTSRRARLAAAACLALSSPQPDDAVQQVLRQVALAAGDPTAPGRQLSAFLRRSMRTLPLIDAPLRRALAQAFAEALDDGDTERAKLLLSPGCAYHNRGQVLTGPQAIADSYARSAAAARARFPGARSESRVVAEDRQRVTIASAERLPGPGGGHTFTCRQHLLFDSAGSVWRIEHEDLPGQVAALEAFLRRSG